MIKNNKKLLLQLSGRRNSRQLVGYFLETSIQIKRLLGHKTQKVFIENHLNNTKKFTSYFVFREFKQAVLVPLIDFYFVLKEEEGGLRDAFLSFTETSQKIRDIKDVNALISTLLERKDLCDNKEKALLYISNYILLLAKLFNKIIDGYVLDLTNFTNSKIELKSGEKEFLKFKEVIDCNRRCGQIAFWREQRKHLNPLTDAANVKKYSKFDGFTDKQDLLNEIKNDINRSEMKSRCLALGDVIIAIECPQNLRLLTTDRAFVAYCDILQKRYGIIPSLSGLRKNETVLNN